MSLVLSCVGGRRSSLGGNSKLRRSGGRSKCSLRFDADVASHTTCPAAWKEGLGVWSRLVAGRYSGLFESRRSDDDHVQRL
eukprot:6183404-Pleurochrysis_carterae.AAC.4